MKIKFAYPTIKIKRICFVTILKFFFLFLIVPIDGATLRQLKKKK